MNKDIQELEQWSGLRTSLNNAYEFSHAWESAISIFTQRMKRKFFNPIQDIINKKTHLGEGFSIVTLQCAIIESLASFKTGQVFNYSKGRNAPSYEYSKSKLIFVSFLHRENIFKDNFWMINERGNKITDSPFSASEFYDKVRCGLMHEARTKSPWHINTTSKSVKTDPVFINEQNGKIELYRTILHYRLLHYLEQYVELLSLEHSQELRRFLGRKLDHLFDFSHYPEYEWWQDK